MNSYLSRTALKIHERFTGRHILERLNELNRTQWLSRDELLALQQAKLQRLLEYAYQYVPYYRRVFDQVGFIPGKYSRNPDSLLKVPILTKAVIRNSFNELISTDPGQKKHLSTNHTGGSTGHPLTFLQNDIFRDYVTADILRHITWTGWELGECHAYIWGADYEVAAQKAIRSRLMDWSLNRFTTNAFSLCDESMLAFTDVIRQRQPLVLFGYASALARYAEFIKAHSLKNHHFLGVISSAEMLYPHQRELLEETFGCLVFNRYGTRELGGLACECQAQNGLHVSIENIHLEILDGLEPAPIGQAGEIVVTNLNNYGMPFIRYRVEDTGQLGEGECSCGRGLPVLQMVHGRTSDLFRTKEGQTIHGEFFTHLFYGVEQVQQFQVIQKTYDDIVVSIVVKEPLPPAKLAFIECAIKDVMKSDVNVQINFVDDIPVAASGKHRFTLSEVGRLDQIHA